jgi:hypothetical protein
MQQKDGRFLNYLTVDLKVTDQNFKENLEDANGRAIWALGTFMFHSHLFDFKYTYFILELIEKAMPRIVELQSPRAIAFTIKGLSAYNRLVNEKSITLLIEQLADKLVVHYQANRTKDWYWFEATMTYANSLLPEALIIAYNATKKQEYMSVAKESFHFLLDVLFEGEHLRVISNRTWHSNTIERSQFGEQPIDVAYTIMALQTFNNCIPSVQYEEKMAIAFDWYHGKNQLNQIVYNPISGGCYDGLEETEVNINQGAEATVTYLMARNCMEQELRKTANIKLKNVTHLTQLKHV